MSSCGTPKNVSDASVLPSPCITPRNVSSLGSYGVPPASRYAWYSFSPSPAIYRLSPSSLSPLSISHCSYSSGVITNISGLPTTLSATASMTGGALDITTAIPMTAPNINITGIAFFNGSDNCLATASFVRCSSFIVV